MLFNKLYMILLSGKDIYNDGENPSSIANEMCLDHTNWVGQETWVGRWRFV